MPNLRQQLGDQLFGAELTKQITNRSQKGLLICTSKLQVLSQFTSEIYKFIFTSAIPSSCTSVFKCSYKCSICLSNFNSNTKVLDSSFLKGILKHV